MGQTLALDGPRPSTRDALRAATHDLHDEIERTWSTGSGFASRAAYEAFLAKLLGVHLDMGVAAAIARGSDAERREELRRIDALGTDLGHDTIGTPRFCDMDPDYAWGVGYVLNGSSLGASMMLRDGAMSADWPKAYLGLGRAYAKDGHLKRYFADMNTLAPNADRVRNGALDTFAALRRV